MNLEQKIEACPDCGVDVAWLAAAEGRSGMVLVELLSCADTDTRYRPEAGHQLHPCQKPPSLPAAPASPRRRPTPRLSGEGARGQLIHIEPLLTHAFRMIELRYESWLKRAQAGEHRVFVDPVTGLKAYQRIDIDGPRQRGVRCLECLDLGLIFVEEEGMAARTGFLCDCPAKERWRRHNSKGEALESYRLVPYQDRFGMAPSERRGQMRMGV